MADRKEFTVEDAQIIFRNFAGAEGQYNTKGDRNFACILPPDLADQMARDGWNIKTLAAREEGDEEVPYIQVSVRFDIRPPKVTQITSSGRTRLTEELIDTLDWADIDTVDLMCRGYEWEVNGKRGVKAYLQTMFVTIEENALERKYAEMELEED